MEFIAVIIALILLQYWGSAKLFQVDGWFYRWCGYLQGASYLNTRPLLSLVSAVVLPSLAVLLVIAAVGHFLFGLPLLFLLVAFLMFSMGRGEFNMLVDGYLRVWCEGDAEAAYQRMQIHKRNTSIPMENIGALHAAARSVIFYRGFERLFAVLFWFLLGGPATAVLYRLVFLYRYETQGLNERQSLIADRLLHWLEWLPVRLLGLTYGVMGNFVKTIQAWQSTLFNPGMSSAQVLNDNGLASLDMDMDCQAFRRADDGVNKERFVEVAALEIKTIQSLIKRSLVVWVVVFALLKILF